MGAALVVYHMYRCAPRSMGDGDSMRGAFLGPQFDQAEIEHRLQAAGARFTSLSDTCLIEQCAGTLVQGRALGWMQGRMEFGPRALGARSILGDPRSPQMQSLLNLKVKYRSLFRLFAPSVLREDVADWFDLDADSPYMLLVADVAQSRRLPLTAAEDGLFGIEKLRVPRSTLPAITHVDYSARIQTVHRETNPRYYALLAAFKELTDCPVLVNTSFNVRGEPIVSYAGRRIPVLDGNRHRGARRRQLLSSGRKSRLPLLGQLLVIGLPAGLSRDCRSVVT